MTCSQRCFGTDKKSRMLLVDALSSRQRIPTTHGRISTCHPSSRYATVMLSKGSSGGFHAGCRHSAEFQPCFFHGCLLVQLQMVWDVLRVVREKRGDQLPYLVMLRRAGVAKLGAYADEVGQGLSVPRTEGTVSRLDQIDVTDVSLYRITTSHRFHPHSVFRFTAPRHHTRSRRPLRLVQQLPNKGCVAHTDCTARVSPHNLFEEAPIGGTISWK
jgi:hypothetical protein